MIRQPRGNGLTYDYCGVWYDDRPGVPHGWVLRYRECGWQEIDESLVTRRRDAIKAACREAGRYLGLAACNIDVIPLTRLGLSTWR